MPHDNRIPSLSVDSEDILELSTHAVFPYRPGEPLPRTVLVIRALQLGDLLVSVPAFRALRRALPETRITLLGLPWARSFVRRFSSYIDDLIEFPGFPGLPERLPALDEIPAFLSSVQKRRFDFALQMHGSGSFVNPLTALFGAGSCAGFYEDGGYRPGPGLFMRYPAEGPEMDRLLRLMEFLGIPLQGSHLEFPLTDTDREEYDSLPESRILSDTPYVCIHPGARMESRRWLPERFARVADMLSSSGLLPVITGSAEEKELCATVSRMVHAPHCDLAGRTSPGALGEVIKGASLLISNDTGVSHIADALGKPRVIIVTGSDPLRWQPGGRKGHRAVCYPVVCRPCRSGSCPVERTCARGVSVNDVMRAVREVREETAFPGPAKTSQNIEVIPL